MVTLPCGPSRNYSCVSLAISRPESDISLLSSLSQKIGSCAIFMRSWPALPPIPATQPHLSLPSFNSVQNCHPDAASTRQLLSLSTLPLVPFVCSAQQQGGGLPVASVSPSTTVLSGAEACWTPFTPSTFCGTLGSKWGLSEPGWPPADTSEAISGEGILPRLALITGAKGAVPALPR